MRIPDKLDTQRSGACEEGTNLSRQSTHSRIEVVKESSVPTDGLDLKLICHLADCRLSEGCTSFSVLQFAHLQCCKNEHTQVLELSWFMYHWSALTGSPRPKLNRFSYSDLWTVSRSPS